METMIDELKALLRNEENLDERELHYEFEQLTDRYQFEEEYSDTFEGFRILYERLHPIYNRDPYSHLAIRLVEDLDFEDYYPQVDNDLEDVQRAITDFIANRVKTGPEGLEGEEEFLLVKHKPVVQITPEDAQTLFSYLKDVTIAIADFIYSHKPKGWHWVADTIAFSQFVFTHMVEATYKTVNNIDEEISANIKDVFSFYEPNVPDWLQDAVYASVHKLDDILYEAIDLIESNDWYAMDYEAWLRPVLYNIGIQGVLFALEQKEE